MNIFLSLPMPLFAKEDDTSSLVGPALDGIIEWFSEVLDLEGFVNTFFLNINITKAGINELFGYFSVLDDLKMLMIYIAGIIMFGLFGLHIVLVNLNYASDSSQKQTLVDLIARLPVTIVLILFIRDIFEIIDTIVNDILSDVFFDYSYADGLLDSASATTVGSLFGTGLSITLGAVTIFPTIIVLVLWICIIIDLFKLLIEIAERNIVLWVLDILSPLAASSFVSRTTNAVFTNYLRMYFSQSLLCILNQIFLVFTLYTLGNTFQLFDIGYLICVIAILKTAQRIDSHMKSLGLTVAQTGGTILDSIGMGIAGISSLMKGVSSTGGILAASGAATGNFGLATIGNNLQSIGRGDFANIGKESAMAKFQSHGGFKNASLANTSALSKAVEEAKAGNFHPINNLTPDVRTQALKKAFGAEGIESIKNQTGMDLNNAKNLSINPQNGDISGIVSVKDINGSEKDMAFKTSATPLNASSKQISGITGECYMTPMTNGIENGFRTDNTQLMSTLTGASLKDAISNSGNTGLGISSNEYQTIDGHGYVNHYNDTGNVVAMTDIQTGEFYSMGTEYAKAANSEDVPFVTQQDIAALDESENVTNRISDDGLLGGYDFGSNAHIVSGSFQSATSVDNRSAVCQVKSNSGEYYITMSAPIEQTNSLMTNRKNVYVGNLGKERGHVVVKVKKQITTKGNKYD